ncbi:hypothetical protein BGX27_009369, partial [Mortierella sp. AM989]
MMDNKRRAKELELTPTRPWPTIQRRKIEKLRDQRQEEFERACNDNFDWLENYYQGCVYAARQNKRIIERRQLSSRSTDSNIYQSHTPDTRDPDHSHNITSPVIALSELSFDGNIQAESIRRDEPLANHSGIRTPTAAGSPNVLPERRVLQDPQNATKDLELRARSKVSSVQFQLRSPRTPKLSSPMRSPRSPYDRQRKAPRRTRLRVDASAATRKTMRIMKALRKRTSSYGNEHRNGTRNSDTSMQLLSTQDTETQQDKSGILEHMRSRSKEPLSSIHLSKPSHLSTDSDEAFFSSKETLVIPNTLDVSFSGSDTSFSHKTPSRETIGKRPRHLRLDGDDIEDMNEALDTHSTPGSKARDSMTLISPATWSGLSKGPDSSFLGSTPRLSKTHGGKSLGKATNNSGWDMDLDQGVVIQDADYNRPRSSPFQDSVAPVRFGSPGADFVQDAPLRKSKEIEKNSKVRGEASNNSLQRDSATRDSVHSKSPSPEGRNNNHSNTQRPTYATSSSNPALPTTTRMDDDNRKRMQANNTKAPLSSSHSQSRSNAFQGALNSWKESQASASGSDPTSSEAISDIKSKSSNRAETLYRLLDASSSKGESASGELEQVEKVGSDITSKANGDHRQHSGTVASLRNDTLESRDSQLGVSGSTRSTTTLATDNVVPRPRVATALPEKRTVGQRKFATSNLQSQATGSHMPPSRLFKITSSLSFSNQATSSQGAPAPNQPQSSITHSANRNLKSGTTSLFRDPQHLAHAPGAKLLSTTTSASNLLRQGVPRAPLPSMKPTESSLARSESQPTLGRKPFLMSKSTFSLKKPTRPVLPDSTLTAKSIALSGITTATPSRSVPATSPKKDHKRELTPIGSRRREYTPDVTPRATGPFAQSSTVTTTVSTVNTPAISLKNSLAALATAGRDIQNKETNNQQTGNSNSSNPFIVPAPINPPSMPARAQNQHQHHERTILPEIRSDGEDGADQESRISSSHQSAVPDWAEWDELDKAMHQQSHMNPEDIFGPLPALDMSEIFPGKEKKARPRTSSAHWGVADRLTTQEVV